MASAESVYALDSSYGLDLDAVNFTVAFAVEGYFDHVPKDDPDFVEW